MLFWLSVFILAIGWLSHFNPIEFSPSANSAIAQDIPQAPAVPAEDAPDRPTESTAPTPFQTALDSIQAKDARQHVMTLASDTFEGRDAGSRGGKAAGIYLSQQFRKFNLQA